MMWKWVDLLLWRLLAGCVVLASSIAYVAHANYSVTPSVGNTYTFGSTTVSGVQYPNQMICDFATGNAQCMTVDSSGNAHVGGSTSNAGSGVATSSGSSQGIAYNYGFNGTTWDQLQVDGSKNLKVTGVGVAQGAATAGVTQSLVGCAVTTSPPSYTTAEIFPCSLDALGNIRSAIQASPAGGWTYKTFVAAGSDNATNLKNAAGVLHAVQVFGTGASPAYLKFYDTSTTPTCASSTVVKELIIPAGSSSSVAVVLDTQFTNGISYCVTANLAVSDDTSVAAATFVVNMDYN